MTEARADTCLDRWRIAARFEHRGIEVELERQSIATRERCPDCWRRMTHVAQHSEPPTASAEDELAGLARIVRHRERENCDRADRQLAIELHAFVFIDLVDCPGCSMRRPEGDRAPAPERT